MTWWLHAAEMALNVSCSHMISNKGGNVGVGIYKSPYDIKVVLWIIWGSESKICSLSKFDLEQGVIL